MCVINKSIKKLSLVSLFLASMALMPSAWATTYTVTNTNDSGVGSLREAIKSANANTGNDVIDFNISTHSAGPHIITLSTPLPAITDPVSIDGFTQAGVGVHAIVLNGVNLPLVDVISAPSLDNSGYSAAFILVGRDRAVNTSLIALDGPCVGGVTTPGCKLVKNPDGSTIRGLTIYKFPRQAIYLYGADNVTVIGNYIGIDETGTKSGFQNGLLLPAVATPHDSIRIEGSNENYIGTTKEDFDNDTYHDINRNVIGASTRIGISVSFLNERLRGYGNCTPANCRRVAIGASDNALQGNYIGTDAAGSCIIGGVGTRPIPDPSFASLLCPGPVRSVDSGATGIIFPNNQGQVTDNNVIGGLKPGQGNVIVAMFGEGINFGLGTNNKILGNIIGMNAAKTSLLLGARSTGILLQASEARVEGNTIARNDYVLTSSRAGIRFTDAINIIPTPPVKSTVVNNDIVNNFGPGIVVQNNGTKLGFDLVEGKIVAMPNRIAHNAKNGVLLNEFQFTPPLTILPTPHLAMLYNSIYDNQSSLVPNALGIDIFRGLPPVNISPLVGDGPNLNDPHDLDASANDQQNYPVLDAARSFINPALVKVVGTFNSKADRDYLLQFFSNDSAVCVAVQPQLPLVPVASPNCTTAGFPFLAAQGKVFIGETTVHTDMNGDANFSLPAKENIPVGNLITATATSLEKVDGVLTPIDTSEFSQAVDVDKKGSPTAYEHANGAAGGDGGQETLTPSTDEE